MRYAFFLFVTLFFIACQKAPKRDVSTVFRYNEAAGITSLDPAFARNQANIWATHQIFNGLVQMDENLKVQPCIAKRWQLLDSGKTYRFFLNTQVLFHDNKCFASAKERLVTAHDIKYSFERLLSAKLAAPGAWVFKLVDEFIVQNDSVFDIKLSQAFSPFLGILTMKYCSVVPQEAIAYYGNNFRQNPVGTGPFYFKLWAENEKLVLRKNNQYFESDSAGKPLPYLEAVAVSFIPDKQSAFLEFVKGNLDLISGLDPSYKDELLTFEGELQDNYKDNYTLYRQAYLNTEYLAFLVDSAKTAVANSPVLNLKVRQALNYSFDRQKMMRYLRNSVGTPATAGMIPKGLPAFDTSKITGYHYNPAKAKALLAQAGFPNGKGLPEISLQTNSSYLDLCEYIQGEAQKVGFKLKVEVSPASTLRQGIATGKVPFFRASWIGDYPDAENYLSLFYSKNWSPNGPNYSHFKNAIFDSLYVQATYTVNDAARYRLYQKMDSLVMQHAPVVPLYYDQVLRFYPKKVQGLGGNTMNLLELKEVYKK
jgi:peptide/nickel transport system substrate-binding protein